MVAQGRAALRAARRRYNFRGRMTDAAYYLLRDWKAYEMPKPSNAVCADRLGVSEATVGYWEHRVRSPSETPPPVPPARPAGALTDDMIRGVLAEIAGEKTYKVGKRISPVLHRVTFRKVAVIKYPTVSDICCEFNRRKKSELQQWTIRRHLKAMGYRCVKKARGPFLNIKNKALRVAFARRTLQNGTPRNIAFTDECLFDVDDHGLYQWVGPGQVPMVQYATQGGEKLLVWGLIANGQRLLVVLPKGARMGATEHVNLVLKPNRVFLRQFTVQQDNAASHTAAETKAWLLKYNITCLDGWPAFSPDLSPIENVWRMIKAKVSRHAPYGYDDLVAYVTAEFNAISQQVLDDLVASFERRLREVVRLRGGVTKY